MQRQQVSSVPRWVFRLALVWGSGCYGGEIATDSESDLSVVRLPSDDAFEPNDTVAAATPLAFSGCYDEDQAELTSLRLTGSDPDFFRVATRSSSDLAICVTVPVGARVSMSSMCLRNTLPTPTISSGSFCTIVHPRCEDMIVRLQWADARSPLQSLGYAMTITRYFDRDHDLVLDASDNCPDVFNPTQTNSDGDVAGDACDAAQTPCLSATSSCWALFTLSNGQTIPYYRSYSLSSRNTEADRAIVVVHGASRNASGAFDAIVDPMVEEGVSARTLVVAPHFRIEGDDGINPGEMYWTGGWAWGGRSASDPAITSYDVVDEILATLADRSRFPNLDAVTVIGHSAGGQFTQRYAGASDEVPAFCTPTHFIVGNPSSYLYLNPYRPDLSSDPEPHDGFVIPTQTCSGDYDSYGYGLGSDLYYYVQNHDPANLPERYTARRVTYLLGTADTLRNPDDDTTDVCDGYVNDTAEGALDRTCAADLEGCNRLERGIWYFSYLEAFFPEHAHDIVFAAGVGHSAGSLYASVEGRETLFP